MLSRVDAGDRLIEKNVIEIESLVRDLVEDADFEARSHGRRVVLRDAHSCRVFGNADLHRSAIENVIRNAIRYTAGGTVVEVCLSGEQRINHAFTRIQIRDHGPGFPEQSVDDLFRPFYRLDDSRERGTGGVGLGLAITKRAIVLHDGQVTAANAAGGGLKVDIMLPTISGPHRKVFANDHDPSLGIPLF